MEVLAHRWGHALHLSAVQGNVPGVEFTRLRRLECTRMLRRSRSFFEGNQGPVTKGRAYCGAVFQNMSVRPENPANWEVVGMVEYVGDGSFASCWNSQTRGMGPGDPFDTPQCFLSN